MDEAERAQWLAYRAEPTEQRRNALALRYAPLVKYVAGRMAVGMPPNVDRNDLTSYGMFGLLDAIDKFDVDAGNRFETYAVQRVRGAIVDELRSMDWVPRSVRRKARQIERAIEAFEARESRGPTDEELADALDLSPEELARDLSQVSVTSMAALDGAVAGAGDTVSLIDTIADDEDGPAQQLDRSVLRELLRDAIGALPEREQQVIALYYFEGMTLAQVGEVIGVTESRVSQVHSKIVLSLRGRLRRAGAA